MRWRPFSHGLQPCLWDYALSDMAYNHVYVMTSFQTWPSAMSMGLRPFRHGLQPCLWDYALSDMAYSHVYGITPFQG
ncbi:STAG domain-containing protein [Mariniradius sediminis]|uniref:STAG domain-containing protein n=1 Tax=Mariniradius sediminis TaxID=2909237 RepID=A0ABS9BSU2_9BACT|nr:STAG domain-containing protein [Mariniradius sediminis]MCF1751112.1 STAG domain-containing protein [Mariniradius sediminis]